MNQPELIARLQQLAAQAGSLPAAELADQLTSIAAQLRALEPAGDSGTALPPSTQDKPQTQAPKPQKGKQAGSGQAGQKGSGAGGGAPAPAQGPPDVPAPAGEEEEGHQPAPKKQKKAPREFDFSKYRSRYVALEVLYVGWDYHGFARQETTENTIEGHLFAALRRTRLIPPDADISTLRYSRCGRTDKGVSALGQVVALQLRSNARAAAPAAAPAPASASASLTTGPDGATGGAGTLAVDGTPGAAPGQEGPGGMSVDGDAGAVAAAAGGAAGAAGESGAAEAGEPFPPPEQEIDYPRILNKALPEEIRVLGWTPVDDSFHARFSARHREYKYFIVDSDNTPLDIGRMREAAAHFVGGHDFRNFCKLDVLAVKSFVRRIESFDIQPAGIQAQVALPLGPPTPDTQGPAATHSVAATAATAAAAGGQGAGAADGSGAQGQQRHACSRVYAMTIRGSAFLWHQVRCMAAVLLLVGRGQEDPGIVATLLDVSKTPCKPQYQMAAEEPLLLYGCGFSPALPFIRGPRLIEENVASLRSAADKHLVAAALTATAAARLAADAGPPGTGGSGAGPAPAVTLGEGSAGSAGQGSAAAGPGSVAQGKAGGAQGKKGAGGGGAGAGTGPGVQKEKGPAYVPLLKRPVEMSVEERMRKHGLPWPPPEASYGRGRQHGGAAHEWATTAGSVQVAEDHMDLDME